MKRIGITGPTGSGKTTVLRALEKLGVAILDADVIYYTLLRESAELNARLVERFGEEILNADGQVERKALGKLVFGDPAALLDLNAITHGFVRREVDRLAELARTEGKTAVAVDAIALVESGMANDCDSVVAVVAPAEVRVRRIMARDGISEDYARSRVMAQQPEKFYRQHSDLVLENDGSETPEAFEARALTALRPLI